MAAQTPAPPPAPRQLFDQQCQTCHGSPDVPQASDPSVLRRMTPERIYESMATGSMQAQAAGLSDASRRAIAEYLGDRKLGAGPAGAASVMPNRVLWEHDAMREVETVNRVPARGGSMGAAGPTVAGGMVFVGSGYIGVRSGAPGNVLLAFAP